MPDEAGFLVVVALLGAGLSGFVGSTMLGLASLASIGGFGRSCCAAGIVGSDGAATATVVETVSTTATFSLFAGVVTGVGAGGMAFIWFIGAAGPTDESPTFLGVEEALVAVGGLFVGAFTAGGTATTMAGANGQRCPWY